MGTAERKQREKDLRRKQILDAAEKTFLEKGFDNTTMDEIAEVCELSKGTLYLYFRNKNELYFHVLLEILDQYCDLVEEEMARHTGYPERLASLGRAYLTFYDKYPLRFRLVNEIRHPHHEEYEEVVMEEAMVLVNRASRVWNLITGTIREGVELGYFKTDIDPMKVGLSLWAGGYGIIRLMDHVMTTEEYKCEFIDNIDSIGFSIHRLKRRDFEEMLELIWGSIISSIKTEKSLIPEIVQ
jgi:AcrR family transcriptional regulator